MESIEKNSVIVTFLYLPNLPVGPPVNRFYEIYMKQRG